MIQQLIECIDNIPNFIISTINLILGDINIYGFRSNGSKYFFFSNLASYFYFNNSFKSSKELFS